MEKAGPARPFLFCAERAMLALFTDFGCQDPYVGQVKAVLASLAPAVPIVDLLHAVPDFNAHAGAHLLDAFRSGFPVGTVFLCVVDPGVGGPRQPLVAEADGQWFVGPDNGLLSVVTGRARQVRYWRIDWQPESLSNSFHGRDLFAPIAGAIAAGNFPTERLVAIDSPEVRFDSAELPRIIYIDHYGNAWTGIRGGVLADVVMLEVRGNALARRTVFHEAQKGEAFWYINSSGLAEIAVNRSSAAGQLGLKVGDPVRLPGTTASH
jgi:S-adenosylmethionine hydrolase